jgi:hypothetical protein
MTKAPAPHDHESSELEEPAAPQTPPETAREVARGRSARTPFLALGSVALVVWLTAALIATVVVLLWIFL